MDTSEFDAKIKASELNVEKRLEEIEAIVSEFIEATGSHLTSFTKKKVNQYVTTQSQVTKSMKKEDLSKLKSGCRDLINRSTEIAKEELNKDNTWKHRDLMTAEKVYPNSHIMDFEVRKTLDIPIQRILGYPGELIIKSGYKNEDMHGHPEWQNTYPGFGYKYAAYSPEMEEIIKKYADEYEKYNNAVYSLHSAKNEKEMSEAADKWDQVE